ncbi:hypothetical protein M0812_22466 [Anaeramoeba flamelloides]|uniref:Uncharacterized protein n=1 Tax=Anaeramoeba flamelloides TaxID=1746091 RepID=A0AAV7YXC6_9EUKA|nr:hypothetical protein M0812_22466 [Anaeramoeba flamelloides]
MKTNKNVETLPLINSPQFSCMSPNTKIFKLSKAFDDQSKKITNSKSQITKLTELTKLMEKTHQKEKDTLENHIERRGCALESTNKLRNIVIFEKNNLDIENKKLKKELKQLQNKLLFLELENKKLKQQDTTNSRNSIRQPKGIKHKKMKQDETNLQTGEKKKSFRKELENNKENINENKNKKKNKKSKLLKIRKYSCDFILSKRIKNNIEGYGPISFCGEPLIENKNNDQQFHQPKNKQKKKKKIFKKRK